MATEDVFRARLDPMIDLRSPLRVLDIHTPSINVEDLFAPALAHRDCAGSGERRAGRRVQGAGCRVQGAGCRVQGARGRHVGPDGDRCRCGCQPRRPYAYAHSRDICLMNERLHLKPVHQRVTCHRLSAGRRMSNSARDRSVGMTHFRLDRVVQLHCGW